MWGHVYPNEESVCEEADLLQRSYEPSGGAWAAFLRVSSRCLVRKASNTRRSERMLVSLFTALQVC